MFLCWYISVISDRMCEVVLSRRGLEEMTIQMGHVGLETGDIELNEAII